MNATEINIFVIATCSVANMAILVAIWWDLKQLKGSDMNEN